MSWLGGYDNQGIQANVIVVENDKEHKTAVEPLTSSSGIPRFSNISDLGRILNQHMNLTEDADIYLNVDIFRHLKDSKWDLLNLGQYKNMVSGHPCTFNGSTFLPLISENSLEKIIPIWLETRPERLKSLQQKILLKVMDFPDSTERGLRELWELSGDISNHEYFSDDILERVLNIFSKSERNSENQIVSCGVLQSMVCVTSTKKNLENLGVVRKVIECLRAHISSNLLMEEPPKSGEYLLQILIIYARDSAAAVDAILNEMSFFSACIQSAVNTDFYELLLKMFHLIFNVDFLYSSSFLYCCNYNPKRNMNANTYHSCKTMTGVQFNLVEFLREISTQCTSSKANLNCKNLTSAIMANFAIALELQVKSCVCKGKLFIEKDDIPLLQPLREVLLASRTVPNQLVFMGRLFLASCLNHKRDEKTEYLLNNGYLEMPQNEEDMVDVLFNLTKVAFAWCTAVASQCITDKNVYVRYRNSSSFGGTAISEKECNAVLTLLLHLVGFLQERWIKTKNRQLLAEMEILALGGISKLLSVPQLLDRIVPKYNLSKKSEVVSQEFLISFQCDYALIHGKKPSTSKMLDFDDDWFWPSCPMLVCLRISKCLSATSTEIHSRILFDLLSTGQKGFQFVSDAMGLNGMLFMLQLQSVHFQRSKAYITQISSCILLLAAGPMNLRCDLDIVSKLTPISMNSKRIVKDKPKAEMFLEAIESKQNNTRSLACLLMSLWFVKCDRCLLPFIPIFSKMLDEYQQEKHIIEAVTNALWLYSCAQREDIFSELLLEKVHKKIMQMVSTKISLGHFNVQDQRIYSQSVNFLWNCFTFHPPTVESVFNSEFFRLVRSLVLSSKLNIITRENGLHVLFYLQSKFSNFDLFDILLELMGDKNRFLRCQAALLLAQKPLKKLSQYREIRESGKLDQLLKQATDISGEEMEMESALFALLNCCSLDNQVYVAKNGLYSLITSSWVCHEKKRKKSQILTSLLLTILAKNPKNRTLLYQAELRIKEMAHVKHTSKHCEAEGILPAAKHQEYTDWFEDMFATEETRKMVKVQEEPLFSEYRSIMFTHAQSTKHIISSSWNLEEQQLVEKQDEGTTLKQARLGAMAIVNKDRPSKPKIAPPKEKKLNSGISPRKIKVAQFSHQMRLPTRLMWEKESFECSRWNPFSEIKTFEKSRDLLPGEYIESHIHQKNKNVVYGFPAIPGSAVVDIPKFQIDDVDRHLYQKSGNNNWKSLLGQNQLEPPVLKTEEVILQRVSEARSRLDSNERTIRKFSYSTVFSSLALYVYNWSATKLKYAVVQEDKEYIPRKQPDIMDHLHTVRWNRQGVVLDENFVLLLKQPAELLQLARDADHATKCAENVALQEDHMPERKSFDPSRCFAEDAKLIPNLPDKAKGIFHRHSGLIYDVFEFYSSLYRPNPFMMRMTHFLRFAEDILVSNKEELDFKSVFQQLPIIDITTEELKDFNSGCEPLGIRRVTKELMRHQFFQILNKLSQMLYGPDGLEKFLETHLLRNLGNDSILQKTDWLEHRFHNMERYLTLPIFREWFSKSDNLRKKWGSVEGQSMCLFEWHEMIDSLGLFNAQFTRRESTMCFVQSTKRPYKIISDWREAVSLDFDGFMEAIARVVDAAVVPTLAQLEFYSVENIVQFYKLMNKTGMWKSFECDRYNVSFLQCWGGRSNKERTMRPLNEKMQIFMMLFQTKDIRARETAQETNFWENSEEETSFEVLTAAKLHDVWRSTRTKENGIYEPRIKSIDGVEYDIANLEFQSLPEYFKIENVLAAHAACESIRRCWRTVANEVFTEVLVSNEFLEQASEEQHAYWLRRNQNQSWVSQDQKVPYVDLSETEKEKDRAIVKTAIEVYFSCS